MSIANEITRLQNAKSNLKTKLQDKGVSVGNERLDEMVNLVDNIETGTDTTDATATSSDILLGKTAYVNDEKIEGTIETYSGENEGGEVVISPLKRILDGTTTAEKLFRNYPNDDLSELIQYNDTENVTNFNSIFYGNRNATIIPYLNTSNGTTFNSAYCMCEKVLSLKVDTYKATNLTAIFYSALNVKKIDITHYNISSTKYSDLLCADCRSLKALIIRSFGANYVLNNTAFSNCYWLLGQTAIVYNPNGEQGYIYVPRDMIATLQSATNWSTMQFRALEDYTLDGTTTGEFDDEKAGI